MAGLRGLPWTLTAGEYTSESEDGTTDPIAAFLLDVDGGGMLPGMVKIICRTCSCLPIGSQRSTPQPWGRRKTLVQSYICIAVRMDTYMRLRWR